MGFAERVRWGNGPPGAVVAVLVIAGTCSAFMMTLVVPMQSHLPEWLNASRSDTAWVVTVTAMTAALSNPIAGRLGDMYGKRRIVLVLVALLIAGSIVAASSGGVAGVIVGRSMQGTAVGVIPLGISILRDTLPRERVDSAVALMSATLGVGSAVGLPLGALVVELGDWRTLFWATAVFGAVVFVLILWLVPVSVLVTAGRFDFLGALGLTAGLLCLLLAISRGHEWGWTSPITLVLAASGVVVLVAWGWFELRVGDALVNLRTASRRPVLLTNLASLAFGFALMSSNVTYPQLLGLPTGSGVGVGLSMIQTGLVLMPVGIVVLFLAPVAGRLARTLGPRVLLIAGSGALIASYGFSLIAGIGLWQVFVANLGVGVGVGLGYAAMPMLIMRSVPARETAASNGVNGLARALGTSTAAAVAGAVLAASTVDYEGLPVPTEGAFQTAFVFGLSASVLALVLTVFIPSRPQRVEPRPALPAE